MDIHFDNLTVEHYKGKLLEEHHYYPYGLTLSTQAIVNAPVNNLLWGSKTLEKHEFSDKTGLDWYHFDVRSYDPQTGRWRQADLLAEAAPGWTPYRFGFDNPVNFSDPSGLLEMPLNDQSLNLDGLSFGGGGGGQQHSMNWMNTHSSSSGGWSSLYGEILSGGTGGWGGYGSAANFHYSFGLNFGPPPRVNGQDLIYDQGKWGHREKGYWERNRFKLIPYESDPDEKYKVATGTKETVALLPDKWHEAVFYSMYSGAQNNGGALQQLADGMGQVMNAGGVVWGGAELGIQRLRQMTKGPQRLARAIGYGTQLTAKALRGTLGVVSKVGKGLGVAGYGLQVAVTGARLLNGQSVGTAEAVGLGVSTALIGAGAILAGTAAAPFVAAGALIYGVAQLGSYMFTEQTVEEHIFGK